MKTTISLLSLLISTQLFAQDKLNIYPDITQYVFEKKALSSELEIELPDSYQTNSFYIENKNGEIPKFYDFKNKSEFLFKENTEVLVSGQKYKFKSLIDNKLVVVDDNNKVSVFNFNNLNSFNFNQPYETTKNAIYLSKLTENETYYGSYLFRNVSFDYKKNLTIDNKTLKGYLNTEFVIVNNTDQDFKNVSTSIMFEKVGIPEETFNANQYHEQEAVFMAKSIVADSPIIENKIIGEKKNVNLGIVDIPSNKTKVIKHLENINFDFIYKYDFSLNFDKKESTIYPEYSLLINKNIDNAEMFDTEAGKGYIYDKENGLILSRLTLNKTEDKRLIINLGKSNATKLKLIEDKKINILNPEEVYVHQNYYRQTIDYIESSFNFENLKENSEINLITNNVFILKNNINEEEIKFFRDKLNLFINSTTKSEIIREESEKMLRDFLKNKLLTMEEYKKSDNYKKGKIFIIKVL